MRKSYYVLTKDRHNPYITVELVRGEILMYVNGEFHMLIGVRKTSSNNFIIDDLYTGLRISPHTARTRKEVLSDLEFYIEEIINRRTWYIETYPNRIRQLQLCNLGLPIYSDIYGN